MSTPAGSRYAGGWHDAGVRVEGNAAGAIHDFYRSLWNEQLTRPVETFRVNGTDIVSHNPAWQPLIARQPVGLPANTGRQYVQVLRTIPQMNFNQAGPRRPGELLVPHLPVPVQIAVGIFANLKGFRRQRFSFAPNGIFEFKVALRKAIGAAEQYIFIADQAMFSFEVMDMIRARMLRRPSLKVILLYGADPADPPSNFLAEAMNQHLTYGLRRDANGELSNIVFKQWDYNTVHCKVTIIDDTWCAIGSANCMRRSLYTDIELSVSTLEEPTPADRLPLTAEQEANPSRFGKTAPSFVQRVRRDFWAHYRGIPLDPTPQTNNHKNQLAALLDLSRALAI